MMDPILAQAIPHVEALKALTQPFGTTLTDAVVYFKSNMPTVATIRTDGKRIAFKDYYHKTNIAEDITYLRACIKADPAGPFTEVSDSREVELAEAAIDPRGAQEKAMRARILAELQASGVDLSALNEEQVNQVAVTAAGIANTPGAVDPATQATVDAANAGGQAIAGVDGVSTAAARLAMLRAQAGQNALTSQSAILTPVSSSDLAGVAGASNGAGVASGPSA